jgi:hypothetical protein
LRHHRDRKRKLAHPQPQLRREGPGSAPLYGGCTLPGPFPPPPARVLGAPAAAQNRGQFWALTHSRCSSRIVTRRREDGP